MKGMLLLLLLQKQITRRERQRRRVEKGGENFLRLSFFSPVVLPAADETDVAVARNALLAMKPDEEEDVDEEGNEDTIMPAGTEEEVMLFIPIE